MKSLGEGREGMRYSASIFANSTSWHWRRRWLCGHLPFVHTTAVCGEYEETHALLLLQKAWHQESKGGAEEGLIHEARKLQSYKEPLHLLYRWENCLLSARELFFTKGSTQTLVWLGSIQFCLPFTRVSLFSKRRSCNSSEMVNGERESSRILQLLK